MLLSPLIVLSESLHQAAQYILPNDYRQRRDTMAEACYQREHNVACDPIWVKEPVRPRAEDCEVAAMFPQYWGGTTGGFGGVGGQMATQTYVTVIRGPDQSEAVFFNGAPAYLVRASTVKPAQWKAWEMARNEGRVASLMEAVFLYGAVPTNGSSLERQIIEKHEERLAAIKPQPKAPLQPKA